MIWIPGGALHRLRDAADAPDLTGTKYEVLERIGSGGMGTVYRALDCDLDREVALKVVSTPDAPPDLGARMVFEARALARLEHPGIVPVHDVGRLPDGRVFYVMKLVRGRRLDELSDAGMPLAEKLRAFERICEAVGFAHAHGVVHRDLKPENVMVGPFGETLVMDWGIAKDMQQGRGGQWAVSGEPIAHRPQPIAPGLTESGAIVGTPGYMAPEQAAGMPELVGPRADVYALGAILCFLLTGAPPQQPASATDDAEASGAPDVALPRPLAAIVAKAMRASPADRYESANALAADASAFRTGLPVSAYRESALERALRVGTRYRTPIVLVLAYLAMRVLLFSFAGV